MIADAKMGCVSSVCARMHTSRECSGHHRKGTPGIGNVDYVLMSDNSIIKCISSVECRMIISLIIAMQQ